MNQISYKNLQLFFLLLAFSLLPNISNTKNYTKPDDMFEKDWSDPKELELTWRNSIIQVPTKKGRSKRTNLKNLLKEFNNTEKKFPTIIYMHSCLGHTFLTNKRLKLLADNGFLVIAPNSFSRKKYPLTCNVLTGKSGLYKGIMNLRAWDLGNAIKQTKSLTFTDNKNIIIMGLSEGAGVVAVFPPQSINHKVKGRIIESWGCASEQEMYPQEEFFKDKPSELNVIAAEKEEVILTMLALNDPFFKHIKNKEGCGPLLNKKNGSVDYIYSKDSLINKHGLLGSKEPKEDLLKFLRKLVPENKRYQYAN